MLFQSSHLVITPPVAALKCHGDWLVTEFFKELFNL